MRIADQGVQGPIVGQIRRLVSREALAVSSAWAPSPFDGIATALPGVRHVRFLPWCDPAFADVGPVASRDDASVDTRVVLGADNVDLVAQASPFACIESGTRAASVRKLRRLDALFGAVAPVAGPVEALFLGEASERSLAILEGATGVLETHRPLVLLPLDGAPAAASALALLCRMGYQPFDPRLRRLEGLEREPGTWCLAVPEGLAEALGTFQGEKGGVARWTLPIEGSFARHGFHPIEGVPPTAWSWIGPRPRAALLLPAWAGRLATVSLHLRAMSRKLVPQDARAALDGRPASVRLGDAALEIHVPPVAGPKGFSQLDLSFPDGSLDLHHQRQGVLAVTAVQLTFAVE